MELKKSQVRYIERDLIRKGVHYPPLREDLLDHICSEIETHLSDGARFKDAYHKALDKFLPEELTQTQKKTMYTLTSLSILKSYFQTAYRNILRRKAYTAINVFGLTVSMSICILIFIFIRYELSYDQQHPHSDTYRLTSTIKQADGQVIRTAFTGAPWGPAMVEEFPELRETARIMKYRLDVLVSDNKTNSSFYESDLIWGDQNLLQFFDIQLVQGNQSSALSAPNTVVISEQTAKKYFGNESAIGQSITYNGEVNLVVTGVMDEMPENMHFKADLICSFSTLKSFWSIIDSWTVLYYHTYFQIQEDADIKKVESRFPDFFAGRIGENWIENRSATLQSVKEIHLTAGVGSELKAGTNIQYLYVLGSISVIILLLACANFVNLNVARSLKRTKEVGIRKVMGGLRTDLVQQFVLESGFLVLISLAFSLLLSQLLLPFFNQLLTKNLTIFENIDGLLIAYLVLIVVLVSALAGVYPALKASSLGTISALKGKVTSVSGRSPVGDGLVLFQFIICATLIIAIGIIKLQQQFIFNKDLGYSTDQMLVLSTNNMTTDELPWVKQELLKIPAIQHVSITSHKLAGDQPYSGRYRFSGSDFNSDTLSLGRLHVDESFIKTYNLNLAAGRDYNAEIRSDTTSFLINEKTAEILGVSNEDALDLKIDYQTQGENGRYPRVGRIIGVVENFHFETLHEQIEGLVMDIQPPRAHFIACKLNESVSKDLISSIDRQLESFTENAPLEHFYLEDELGRLYATEKKLDVLISIAAGVAITIALLGLLALVSQLTAFKKREIGLRKVLGANPMGITILLSKKYLRIISVSLLVAFPISYLWMNEWLRNYPYRIDFPILWMLLTGVLITVIALTTIGLVTRRAATANPVNALKED